MEDGIIQNNLLEMNSEWGRNYNYIVINTSSFALLTKAYALIPVTTKADGKGGGYGFNAAGSNTEEATIWAIDDK